MKKVDFYLFYEGENREIENDTLIKCELERRGYSCVIGRAGMGTDYGLARLFWRPKVIVTPWLRYDSNVYLYSSVNPKATIVNLQWEQVYNNDALNCGLTSIGEMAKGAYHLCWGQNSFQRLVDAGVNPDRLRITGPVHLDYGRCEFKNYYYDKKTIADEFSLDMSKKWFLFVSSFAFGCRTKGEMEELDKSFGGTGVLMNSYQIQTQTIDSLLKWFEALLQKTDNILIYRPHPDERQNKKVLALAEKYDNFKIISAYSIKQWFFVCDTINSWFSTALAEAVTMDKKVNIIRPVPLPDGMELECLREAYKIESEEEFIQANLNPDAYTGKYVTMDELSYFYDERSDIPSYIRTADALEDILLHGEKTEFCFSKKDRKRIDASLMDRMVFKSILSRISVEMNLHLSKICPLPHLKKTLSSCENFGARKKTKDLLEKKMTKYYKEHLSK